jgi:hypothetical protein
MLAAGSTLGPYRILAPLGAGGMGEVYRAHDPRLGRDVAIKVLSPHLAATPEARARFEREARTISQLNHPHICTLHDIGHQDGTDYLVMELLEGETLAHRLEKGPLPLAEVLTLGAQIADALDRAHRAGVVHRDLKPGNVMLTKSGAKLMDFGLARAAGLSAAAPGVMTESPTVSRPLTKEGTIVGTFQYMAPEQLEGKEADARSDLWALGCVLYEMATGKRAFEGDSQASLIAAILDREPRPITELQPLSPPALERIVKHCLEKSPEARFQSARDLAFDLESVIPVAAGVAPAGAVTPAAPRRRAGRRIAAAVLLVLGAMSIAFVAGRLGRSGIDASRVTYTRLTVQRGRVQNARFSADGKTVLYSGAWSGLPLEVFEVRPGVATSRPLGLPQTDLLSVSRSGSVAVTLGLASFLGFDQPGTLAEIPTSGGAPRRLLEDVVSADWTPGARTLAVAHYVGGKCRLEMPPGRVLYETSGALACVRIAPSGGWLAFIENPVPPDIRGSVVIADTVGRVAARTSEWNFLPRLAWAADGREVWFSASQDNAASDIRALRPDGSQRVVARLSGTMVLHDINRDGQMLLSRASISPGIRGRRSPADDERELGWLDFPFADDISPDGRVLLFDEQGVGGGPLYTMCMRGMDGAAPVRLGEGKGCALSPDGKWALAIHYGPPHRLLLLPTGAGDSTSLPRGSVERYLDARWTPDGQSVVFVGSRAGQAWRTYIQDLVGGLPRPVTPDGVIGTFVSPDGRLLATVSKEQQLSVYPMSGGEPRLVGDLGPNEMVCQWTPDGRSLYVGKPGTNLSVSLVERDTGRRVPWKTFSVPDPAGVCVWRIVLTPGGGSYAYFYLRWLDELYLVDGMR